MNVIDWPSELNSVVRDGWFLDGASVSSGRGMDGREQIVHRENRVWINTLSLAGIRFQRIPQWRALVDRLKGRSGILSLPVCNSYTPRFTGDADAFYEGIGIDAADIARGYQPFADGTFFADGTGFALPATGNPVTQYAAPAGATIVRLTGGAGLALTVGAYFSINYFLYRVAVTDGAGLVEFNPPLRMPVAAGAEVEVNNPRVYVRLASDSDARLFADHNRFGIGAELNVVEAFDR